MCAHSSKGGKDVRAAITERKKGDTGNVLVESQDMRESTEVRTEKVRCADTKCAEQEEQPDDIAGEDEGS